MLVDLKDITDWAFYFEIWVNDDIYMYHMGTGVSGITVSVIKCSVACIFHFSDNTDLG